MNKIKEKIMCCLFGHQFINLNTEKLTADCKRCKNKYEVSYDMTYGGTYPVQKLTNK